MKLVSRREIGREAWNALVDGATAGWLYHRWDWLDIEARFFAARDLSFAVVDGDTTAAIHPLYLAGPDQGLGFETVVHSGIHRHAGILLAADLSADRAKAAAGAAMRHL